MKKMLPALALFITLQSCDHTKIRLRAPEPVKEKTPADSGRKDSLVHKDTAVDQHKKPH
ncbi:hypothetical protein B0O44_105273 [Pedobacter nutrimenti]|jgi:hypothetical protein|uniref:Lipoprotein n=1 Tax=Pedobacter nutrimenti TaxID=1241337 RepID=A0A318UE16_9SPHI|nr:hypothetical protein B0O44_105273 [Pedobacter nutrimenti]